MEYVCAPLETSPGNRGSELRDPQGSAEIRNTKGVLLAALLIELALWSVWDTDSTQHCVQGRLYFPTETNHTLTFQLICKLGTAYPLARYCHVPASWQVALHLYYAVQVGLAKRKLSQVSGLAAERL